MLDLELVSLTGKDDRPASLPLGGPFVDFDALLSLTSPSSTSAAGCLVVGLNSGTDARREDVAGTLDAFSSLESPELPGLKACTRVQLSLRF